MSKIFVVPEIPGSSLIRIQLKHPKDWSDCNFYIDPQEGRIYELSTQQNSYYSWFLNDNLINGSFFNTFFFFIYKINLLYRWQHVPCHFDRSDIFAYSIHLQGDVSRLYLTGTVLTFILFFFCRILKDSITYLTFLLKTIF